MIVPMKKVNIIVQAKDAEGAVKKLRLFGVLHVEHVQEPKSKDISVINDDISAIDEALGILSTIKFSGSGGTGQPPISIAKHIIDSSKRLDRLQEYSRHLKAVINQYSGWGDFDPQKISFLSEKNIFVRLYQIPQKQLKGLSASVSVKIISIIKGVANTVVVSRGKTDFPFKEMPLPKMGIKAMRQRLAEDMQVVKLIQEDIEASACHKSLLLEFKKKLEAQLLFSQAISGMGLTGQISYIAGYMPVNTEQVLAQAAKKEKWGIVISEPGDEDNVPTLVKNPKWVDIVKPVFKLLEIVPGYKELDISPLFLIFLSLFFGMIIGDAGYGAVYFLITLIMQKKLGNKAKDKKVFLLFYVFSSCAILWGVLTGTVFGQEWYINAGFKPLIPVLNDTKFLQAFCFFLGAFHLSLAHLWQAIRKLPSLTALSDAGWICVLWSAFFIAKALILSDPFPYFAKQLLILGVSLVILCTSLQKNILKTVGAGLGAVALSLVNNFTDVVSYVRLFAVGLAGVAISDTVNSLAAGFSGQAEIARILILFLGHTINIVLGPMSVLIHGIRLNVLEFSSHANLSWSGVAYKPLKEE